MTTANTTGTVLFEETAQLTGIVEYGVAWNDLVAGEAKLPPQGARFDIAFEGQLTGERIRGKIDGVDYLTVRADGRFDMNIFATITTDDCATIAFHETGLLTPRGDGTVDLRLDMKFTTAHEMYSWLNRQQAWGWGTANQKTGEVRVTARAA